MKKLLVLIFFTMFGILTMGEEKIVPIGLAFSSPDTGIGAAVIAIGYSENEEFDKPNSYRLGSVLSQKGQILLFGGFENYINKGKYKREIGINLTKWPDNYYGVGQDSLYENEDEYNKSSVSLYLKLSKRIKENIVLGPIFEYAYYDIDGLEELSENKKTNLAGMGLKLEYDTRDRIFDARKGSFSELSLVYYNKAFGGDENFSRANLDFRTYKNLFKNTLAFQTVFISENGDVPFYELMGYGGSNIMRGYNEGRYIDKNTIASQVEYRFKISKKFRAAIFAGAGEVFSGIDNFEMGKFKKSYGMGLRYVIDEKAGINFRIDIAFNEQEGEEDRKGMYFTVMEAF